MIVPETSLADTWAGIALIYGAFLYFLAGALGYGNWLRRRILGPASALEAWGDTILFASAFLMFTVFALASLRAFPYVPPLTWWLFPLGGFAGFREVDFISSLRRHWPLALLAAFLFFVRCLSAAIPQQHGDPLLYHLLAPRIWARAGGFVMDPLLPNLPLASSWESLYLWPQLLWQGGSLDGLVEAQIFSQWIHLAFGLGGCAFLVPRLFKGVVREKDFYLLALAGIFVAGVQWTASLAKNDAGVAFWALGCVVFLKEGWESRDRFSFRRFLLSGIFAGLAVSGKINTVLSIAPLAAALLVMAFPFWHDIPRTLRWLAASAAGFVLGAGPVYARNFVLTRNPLYPMFGKVFPSPFLSHSWAAHFMTVAPSSPLHALPRVATRLPELARESPCIVALLALPVLLFFRGRAAEKSVIALLAGAACAYAGFVTTQTPEIELRYLGASLMVLAAGGVWCLLSLGEWLVSAKVARVWGFLLLAGLLATSKIPLHILRKIWHEPLGVAYVRTHTAGEAKAWLRTHVWPRTVVMAGENEAYYLATLPVTVLTEKPDLDGATWDEKDLLRFVEKVCKLGKSRFLLDSIPTVNVEARFGKEKLAPSLVFSAQGAQVYDLYLLEQRLQPGEDSRCRL
jgi:hypothetical protein